MILLSIEMIQPIFDFMGFLILFTTTSWILSWLLARGFKNTKSGFLVADRNLGLWEASFSVAASWIWAPALFISSQKAFEDGWIGLFWFVAPNVSCLILFASFAGKVRREFPQGFTLSQYIREKTSLRVQSLYWVSLSGLTVCAFASQLLAGGQFLSRLTGLSYFPLTVILALLPLSYSLFFGLKATVVTDFAKMIFIFSMGALLIPWTISKGGGVSAVFEGLGGVHGQLNFWSEDSFEIFLNFGLPTTIGLLSGPFGDQTFWQRLFATQEKVVCRAFLQSAFLFMIVPLSMSLLGFLAAGSGLKIVDPQLTNLETVQTLLPSWAPTVFAFMILAGLISILDSKLAAIGSLSGHDWINRLSKKKGEVSFSKVLRSSQIGMVALVILAVLIANIPGLKILHLFLFYGTLRSATVLPTVMLISGIRLKEASVFWGIVISICVGLPLFAYGNLTSQTPWIVIGSLLTLLSSGLFAWATRIPS